MTISVWDLNKDEQYANLYKEWADIRNEIQAHSLKGNTWYVQAKLSPQRIRLENNMRVRAFELGYVGKLLEG